MNRGEFIGILLFMACLAAAPVLLDSVAQAGGAQSFIRQYMIEPDPEPVDEDCGDEH
jgi:hypothetical protein